MKIQPIHSCRAAFNAVLILALFVAWTAPAATLYVWHGSPSPAPPFDTWATAATNIQDAVDAATNGDTVLVTNGVYSTRGRQGRRVSVDKPITLQSVDGPEVTIIDGLYEMGCVTLDDDTLLSGFTLRHGGAYNGGGAYCSSSAVVTNCVIEDNVASAGGGVYGGTLWNCRLMDNASYYGGGASGATLRNCALTGNWTIAFSQSPYGYDFSDGGLGGGAYNCELYNCTVTGNSAKVGGGMFSGAAYNSIVYFNQANDPDNVNYYTVIPNNVGTLGPDSTRLSSSCTTPLPPTGGLDNNFCLDPRLAGAYRLSADSPCIGAGNAEFASGTDIDGEAWGSPPSVGCDEYVAGAGGGPLQVAISAPLTTVVSGHPVTFTATINGYASATVWEFGNGVVVSNRYQVRHAWSEPGVQLVGLRAYNQDHPEGVSAWMLVPVQGQAWPTATHYVDVAGANPMPPYASWARAATNIQDAVDVAQDGDTVLVRDGIYRTGGRTTNAATRGRVVIERAITVKSVNGPEVTVIEGSPGSGHPNGTGAMRCVYLGANAVLNGFTLTEGYDTSSVYDRGAGAWCEASAILTNCIITGNATVNVGVGAVYGGTLWNCVLTNNHGRGAYESTLYNCRVTGNTGDGVTSCALYNSEVSGNSGDGAGWSSLYNCTLVNNSGDGARLSTLFNCIVYFNRGRNYTGGGLDHCCTTPLPPEGAGNISADPRLASLSHLSADSPCIGAGRLHGSIGTDLDGEAWAAPPSIGCDEYRVGSVTGPLQVEIAATYTNVTPGFTVDFSTSINGRTTASVWTFGDGTVLSNRVFDISHTWTAPGTYTVELRAYNESWPDGVAATVNVQVVEDPIHYVDAASTNPVAPFMSWATAATTIQDAVNAAFVNGTILVTNGVYSSGGRAVFGTMTNRVAIDKPLTVQSVNGPILTVIQGAPAPGGGNGDGAIRCAYLGPNTLLDGFTLKGGHTRTTGDYTQDQSGAGAWCDETSLLTNCVLAGNSAFNNGGGVYGGILYSCSLTDNSAGVGGGAFNSTLRDCILSGNSWHGAAESELFDCILSGNSAAYSGGGAVSCTLYNCTLTGNSANNGGGGAYSTLYNCLLTGNSADSDGGGAYEGDLYNCTVAGNWAGNSGGGISGSSVHNSIVYFNSAPDSDNFASSLGHYSYFHFSCTTPLPINGLGNITNAPLFVNTNDWSDLHLRFGSPGIDAGTNLSAILTTDLAGNLRPLDGDGDGVAVFDMGAYEFDARSIIPPDWFTDHGLDASDPQVVSGNPDHDPYTTFQEWIADTDPTNGLSFFHIEAITKASPAEVSFQSSTNRAYTLWSTPQLSPVDWTPVPEVVAIPGTGGMMTLMDATNAPQQFYRVEVNLP